MKEIAGWDNRPRLMWVWDEDDEDKKYRLFVVYIADKVLQGQKRVLAVNTATHTSKWYDRCAEITNEKKRMTNQQLSRWLSEKPGRECMDAGGYISPTRHYHKTNADEEVSKTVRIREDYGEWREPLVDWKNADERLEPYKAPALDRDIEEEE